MYHVEVYEGCPLSQLGVLVMCLRREELTDCFTSPLVDEVWEFVPQTPDRKLPWTEWRVNLLGETRPRRDQPYIWERTDERVGIVGEAAWMKKRRMYASVTYSDLYRNSNYLADMYRVRWSGWHATHHRPQ